MTRTLPQPRLRRGRRRRCRSFAAIFLAVLGILATGHAAAADLAADATGGRVAVTVREEPAEGVWHVGYLLDREAAGVEFVRDRSAFRADRWTSNVRGGTGTWHADGSRERLCFSRPARTFSVAFRTWTRALPGDQPLHVALGDGSRLLHTGHLLVRPLATCEAAPESTTTGAPDHRFLFQTVPRRGIRILDRSAGGSLGWQPAGGPERSATWVVFGEVAALDGVSATVLLDPGLPEALAAPLADALPRIVERFTAATGTALPFRPLVVVAWGGAHATGTITTTSLPGALVASLAGAAWQGADSVARRDAVHRLAREVFRLWSEQTFRADADSAWLADAAAEHFAVEATVAVGAASPLEARQRLVAHANACIVRLAGRKLPAADEADGDAWTPCGAVALAAADGALRRGQPPSSLAHLFRRLFEHASVTGTYGTAAFFGALRELRADPAIAAELWRLLWTGGVQDGDRLLRGLLAHAGVATQSVPPTEAGADPATLREMVARALGRCWCGEASDADCDPATVGRDVRTVAGEPVDRSPLAAWDRLQAAVRRATALPVVVGGEAVDLFCSPASFDPTWDALLTLTEAPPAAAGGAP